MDTSKKTRGRGAGMAGVWLVGFKEAEWAAAFPR
jgi:hypothetical protein